VVKILPAVLKKKAKQMLEKLSLEQESKLAIYRDKWLSIGLQSGKELPSNEELKEVLGRVYKAGGLESPNIIVRVCSPYEGCIAAFILKNMKSSSGIQVRDQVGDQVGDQVRAQVRAQVGDQVWDQVMAQVWDRVGAQVRDQVMAQVWDQVMAQVWDQVMAQVGDQVGDQVRAQVRAQVGDQVGDQVMAQVWDQVRAQVWDQVGDQVMAQVWDQVRAQVWDQVMAQVRAQVGDQRYLCGYGTQDASWLSYLNYFLFECDLKFIEKCLPLMQFSTQVGWWWPFKNAVIVSEMPKTLYMQHGRMHRDLEQAISYSDGFGIYALNGVRFTEDMIKFVITPAKDLNPEEILNIKNVEQRAEIIKKFGIAKLFKELKPKKLDSQESYELYEIDLKAYRPRIYLKMQNPSIDEVHIEAVAPECKTVEQALNWRNFGEINDKFTKPLVLT
jgi:hypothetical protein